MEKAQRSEILLHSRFIQNEPDQKGKKEKGICTWTLRNQVQKHQQPTFELSDQEAIRISKVLAYIK